MWWILVIAGVVVVVAATAAPSEPPTDDAGGWDPVDQPTGPTPQQYMNWRELGTWHGEVQGQPRGERGRYELSIHKAPDLSRFRVVGRMLWTEHARPGNFDDKYDVTYARFYDVAFDFKRVASDAWQVVQSAVKGAEAHIQNGHGGELKDPGVRWAPKPRLVVATKGTRRGDVVVTFNGGGPGMVLEQLQPEGGWVAGTEPDSYFIDSVTTTTSFSWDLKVFAPGS